MGDEEVKGDESRERGERAGKASNDRLKNLSYKVCKSGGGKLKEFKLRSGKI